MAEISNKAGWGAIAPCNPPAEFEIALAQALRERDEAREVLRKVQWSGPHGAIAICPTCWNSETEGHKPDCELSKAISDLPATEGER